MVSGKSVTKGFSIHADDSCSDNLLSVGFNQNARRGSRSLPASPLTTPKNTPTNSPRSQRRQLPNMYFTGPFVEADKEKHGNWILSNLLSKREDISKSVGSLAEAFAGKSIAEIPIVSMDDEIVEKKKATHFKPKPSELREMNFWSPTSM